MAIQSPDHRNRAARDFIQPVLEDGALPADIEGEVQRRIEDGEYVEALVTAIYFD